MWITFLDTRVTTNKCHNNHLNAMVTLHISTVWPNLHACAQQGTRRVAAMDSCFVLFRTHQHGIGRNSCPWLPLYGYICIEKKSTLGLTLNLGLALTGFHRDQPRLTRTSSRPGQGHCFKSSYIRQTIKP